jgi:hypothetical protein
MPIIESKFGMTFEEVRAARERWRKIANDCEWETFDDYLQWMVASGWSKGKHLRKRNFDLPHGPQNSIWVTADKEHMAEVASSIPNVGNPHCDACEKNGTDACDGYGCAEWRTYFQENWDRNIHKNVPMQHGDGREFYQYEHPDLIREGKA